MYVPQLWGVNRGFRFTPFYLASGENAKAKAKMKRIQIARRKAFARLSRISSTPFHFGLRQSLLSGDTAE